jgi:hypothetical protein
MDTAKRDGNPSFTPKLLLADDTPHLHNFECNIAIA